MRVDRARVATLRVAPTGPGYSEAFIIGEFIRANASRGWLMIGAFAKTGSGGTIVGRLASITMGSGCRDHEPRRHGGSPLFIEATKARRSSTPEALEAAGGRGGEKHPIVTA